MAVNNANFKGTWNEAEDLALRKAVTMHGEKNWSVVARYFNTLMGRPPNLGRAPKQCRSRYLQQLVPGIKTGEWSVDEEETLVEGHKQFGNQWTLIASMLPGRTETAVKNHYNCTARRKVPGDLGRLSVLQHYLASIGVISLQPGSAGKAASRSQGTSSQLYAHSAPAAAAPAAPPATAAGARARQAGRSAGGGAAAAASGAPGLSSATSGLYEEYEDEAGAAHAAAAVAYSSYAELSAYYSQQQAAAAAAAMHTYQAAAAQAQAAAAAAAAAAASYGGYPGCDDEAGGEAAEVSEDEGAAAGLLQLARAAMLQDESEGEEPGAAHSHSQPPRGCADMDCDDGDTAQQGRSGRPGVAALQPQLSMRSSRAGRPAWLKPEWAAGSVASGSEASDRTAEDEEGSPLALLSRARGSKRSTNCLSAGAAAAKRAHTAAWDDSTAARDGNSSRAGHSQAHPGASKGSEAQGGGGGSPASPPGCAGSPSAGASGSSGCLLSADVSAQLLAAMLPMLPMMSALLAAKEPAAAAPPAAPALPATTLAAIARVMALSASGLGLASGSLDAAAAPGSGDEPGKARGASPAALAGSAVGPAVSPVTPAGHQVAAGEAAQLQQQAVAAQ